MCLSSVIQKSGFKTKSRYGYKIMTVEHRTGNLLPYYQKWRLDCQWRVGQSYSALDAPQFDGYVCGFHAYVHLKDARRFLKYSGAEQTVVAKVRLLDLTAHGLQNVREVIVGKHMKILRIMGANGSRRIGAGLFYYRKGAIKPLLKMG